MAAHPAGNERHLLFFIQFFGRILKIQKSSLFLQSQSDFASTLRPKAQGVPFVLPEFLLFWGYFAIMLFPRRGFTPLALGTAVW